MNDKDFMGDSRPRAIPSAVIVTVWSLEFA